MRCRDAIRRSSSGWCETRPGSSRSRDRLPTTLRGSPGTAVPRSESLPGLAPCHAPARGRSERPRARRHRAHRALHRSRREVGRRATTACLRSERRGRPPCGRTCRGTAMCPGADRRRRPDGRVRAARRRSACAVRARSEGAAPGEAGRARTPVRSRHRWTAPAQTSLSGRVSPVPSRMQEPFIGPVVNNGCGHMFNLHGLADLASGIPGMCRAARHGGRTCRRFAVSATRLPCSPDAHLIVIFRH